jgi:hypothetical protein
VIIFRTTLVCFLFFLLSCDDNNNINCSVSSSSNTKLYDNWCVMDDGVSKETNTFDEEGRLIASYSHSKFGKWSIEFVYDERDNLIEENRYDYFGAEEASLTGGMTFEYNENDLLIKFTNYSDQAEKPDYVAFMFYDEQDRIVMKEVDNTGDSIINEKIEYVYDDENNVDTILFDYNMDGEANEIRVLTKTPELDILETDKNGDGIINSIIKWHLNENDLLIKYETDDNADGIPEIITNYTYDENNNIIFSEHISDADTSLPRSSFSEYTYDEFGNLLLVKNYDDENNLESCTTYSYECWL